MWQRVSTSMFREERYVSTRGIKPGNGFLWGLVGVELVEALVEGDWPLMISLIVISSYSSCTDGRFCWKWCCSTWLVSL